MRMHVLQNGLVACGLVCTLAAPGGPLVAQGDTTAFPRGIVAAAWGKGSLAVDCAACAVGSGGSVEFLEAQIGVDVTPSVGLVLVGGLGGARAGDFKGGSGWWLVGGRIRPGGRGGFFVQAATGKASVDMDRDVGQDTGLCSIIFGDCRDVEVVEAGGRVYQVGIGYDLPLSRRVAITPQLRIMGGKVAVTTLSVGISGFPRD